MAKPKIDEEGVSDPTPDQAFEKWATVIQLRGISKTLKNLAATAFKDDITCSEVLKMAADIVSAFTDRIEFGRQPHTNP